MLQIMSLSSCGHIRQRSGYQPRIPVTGKMELIIKVFAKSCYLHKGVNTIFEFWVTLSVSHISQNVIDRFS